MISAKTLEQFRQQAPKAAVVRVDEIKGSTPREVGAWMLVSDNISIGTIGGGQLEFMAIERARDLLRGGEERLELDIPLGPEIGQCCGGRVVVGIERAGAPQWSALAAEIEAARLVAPHIYLFGAGHVGTALSKVLALMPFRTITVETRQDMLDPLPDEIEKIAAAMPESVVGDAPPGSAFVILTHDHALDFLITSAALRRGDAVYVGMIGSKTKKATFKHWFADNGGTPEQFDKLVSPIGGQTVPDKRPEIIAALVAAELTEHILGRTRVSTQV